MTALLERVEAGGLPRHVALIMDGNGRWARARGLPRTAGHQSGALTAEKLVRFIGHRLRIPYITLFAFSTENWGRPQPEIDFLMTLLERFVAAHLSEFVDSGIRLRVVGGLAALPPLMRKTLSRAVEATEGGENLHLTIALSYGGRQDIARACRLVAIDVVEGRLAIDDVAEESIAARLYTADIPDPDLVIRTSGERRFSNFLLWQSAYAELYFADVMWPDFTPAEFVRALDDYQRRQRRYGALTAEAR